MTKKEDLIGKEIGGKTIKQVVQFPSEGTFQAFYKAEAFVKDLGFTVGSMCGPEPIGFAKGYDYVAKWRNLTQGDKSSLDGLLLNEGGFREGGVSVVFF